jgi:hypothetical protein
LILKNDEENVLYKKIVSEWEFKTYTIGTTLIMPKDELEKITNYGF